MSVIINLKSRGKLTIEPANGFITHINYPGRPIKRLPSSVDVNPESTPSELASKISSKTGLSIHRLRLTKASDGKVLEDLNIPANETVYVKDLGIF